ncbi:MAG: class I SAM-dependent methyltransferase [Chloroflexi bacterium]|nr:class I SAM-dependent methyltransferase [Chloroflexota bacterium]
MFALWNQDFTETDTTINEPRETTRTRTRYDRAARLYDAMYWPAERLLIHRLRHRLWSRVPSGKILEIGVGTGENINYYPVSSDVTALDLSPHMLARARSRAVPEDARLEMQTGDVQQLDFPDDAFDSAVATFVFCSVPDPGQGLREVARVVRPGGRIFLLEHVRVDIPIIGMMMDIADPVAVRVTGAHVNRRTACLTRRLGIGRVMEERRGPFGMIQAIEIGVE